MTISTANSTIEEYMIEFEARCKAQESFMSFVRYTMPNFEESWHHRVFADVLDKFVSGEIKRLIVTMPPRHTKSEFVSRRLPAYILGRNPDAKIIAVSYGADLSSRMNRDVQRIIDSPEYSRLFPETRLSGKNIRALSGNYLRNNDVFEIVNKTGFYRSSGVGGSIVGWGFDIGIIDDPYKNFKEARSATIRRAVYDWYSTAFVTRQQPNARILITTTRWHEDDLVATLLSIAADNPKADQWHVVNFPAVSEDPIADYDIRGAGEALWPDRFDLDALDAIRAGSGSHKWNALYQQRPTAPEGNRIKRYWFTENMVRAVPRDATFVRYWDKAATQDGGAYTAGVLMADDGSNIYIVDVKRDQLSPFNRERMIKATATETRGKYGRVFIYTEQEPGSGGKDSADATIRNLAGFAVYADKPTGDKDERMYDFESQLEAGNVKMVQGDWNEAYIDELCAIPHGKYRDQADATSGAFKMLIERRKYSDKVGYF